MKRILLPIITLLLIGLTLISCDLFGGSDEDVRRLIYLDVTVSPSNYVFSDGENIRNNLSVKGIYSDSSEKVVTNYSTSLLGDMVTSNTNTVTVSYTEGGIRKEKTVPITVSNGSQTLISLDVKVSPTNYIFSEGDNVKEHLIVKGIYSDGSENIITDYSTDITTVTSTTKSVTVTYGGKSNTLQIFVRDDSKTLFFIDVTLSPTDYVFSEGDDIKEHLKVEGFYSNGTVETITNTDCEITTTTNSVKVTYGSKTKTIPISVRTVKTLNFIDVLLSPTNYVFSEGDDVKDHLIVKGYYSDSSETTITDTDYSTDITTVTSKTNFVEVTYDSKSKTIPISVRSSGSGITLNDIEVITNTNFFNVGENIKDHLIVKGIYSDGVKTISKEGYLTNLPNDKVTSTTKSVTIFYTDGSDTKTKTISITVNLLTSIEVIKRTNNFFEGENIKSLIIVKGHYTDGSEKTITDTDYSTDLTDDKVTSSTNTVEISYTENGIEKKKSITITVNNTSNYVIKLDWFNNKFSSEIDKNSVTSISFLKKEPKDLTNLDGLSYFRSGTDLYVVGRQLIFYSDCSQMFGNFSNVTEINLTDVDTSNVTDMHFMFADCRKLTNLNLSNFNTSNVTDMNFMFANCSQLTSLNLSSFETSKVTDMMNMFHNCSQLTSLNLSNFDITSTTNRTSVPNTLNMFYNVPTTIPIYVSNVSDWSSKFSGWTFQIKTTP